MIRLHYKCSVCSFSSSMMNDAQEHANIMRHALDITGELTASAESIHLSDALSPSLAAKVREDTVMRLAKQRGLIPRTPAKKGGK